MQAIASIFDSGVARRRSMAKSGSFQNDARSVDVTLDNGTKICLRRIRHSDRERIEDGISQMSDQSRYLRFFSGSKTMPPSVVERLASVDGTHHLAWGVVHMDEPDHPAIAAAHVFRETETGDAGEFAIAVLDQYHGHGVARILMATIFIDCYCEGFRLLRIDILQSNKKASGLVRSVGATPYALEGPVAQYNLIIEDAISALRTMDGPRAIQDVVAAFSAG
jgi:GNAT superfamily N-acetyltransferase